MTVVNPGSTLLGCALTAGFAPETAAFSAYSQVIVYPPSCCENYCATGCRNNVVWLQVVLLWLHKPGPSHPPTVARENVTPEKKHCLTQAVVFPPRLSPCGTLLCSIRDGTTEPVSRDQILRRERRQENIYFSCSADYVQDGQPYPDDLHSSCYMCDHTCRCS